MSYSHQEDTLNYLNQIQGTLDEIFFAIDNKPSLCTSDTAFDMATIAKQTNELKSHFTEVAK